MTFKKIKIFFGKIFKINIEAASGIMIIGI